MYTCTHPFRTLVHFPTVNVYTSPVRNPSEAFVVLYISALYTYTYFYSKRVHITGPDVSNPAGMCAYFSCLKRATPRRERCERGKSAGLTM